MPGDFIELQRCRDSSSVAELTAILDAAGIPHRVGSDSPVFDISTIGSGNEAQVIVSVRAGDYDAARSAMEQDCLKLPIPEDHYLHTSSDEELAEIVAQPGEWSAFDVAHARRLVKERGIDPAKIMVKQEAHMAELREGKPASRLLITFGWVCSIFGGLFGIVIAWSLCNSMEKTPDGEFFTYDAKSRAMGRRMLPVACIMFAIPFLWRLFR